ncbi:MAG: DUF6575 domain-containing protein [Prevotella sp.]
MNIIEGINAKLNFSDLVKMSDLIFFDGPLLSHYVHKSGTNYLSYWVDCDDENERWLVFNVGLTYLQRYVNGEISLLNLLKGIDNGLINVVDVNTDGDIINNKLVEISDLPESYFPDEDSLFDQTFQKDADTNVYSEINKSGILEFHFSGNQVKYGNMPFEIYTNGLEKIGEFTESFSNSFIKVKKESDSFKSLKGKEKNDYLNTLKQNTSFQYMYSLAGSVRVLLKPINLQTYFSESSADEYAQEFIRLLKSGTNINDLEQLAMIYGNDVLDKFSTLVEFLKKSKINLGVSWNNHSLGIKKSEMINNNKIDVILQNLNSTRETSTEIIIRGKFYSLNTRTFSFSFEANENEPLNINGYFDDMVKNQIQTLSFEREYVLRLEKKELKTVKNREKFKYTIFEITSI